MVHYFSLENIMDRDVAQLVARHVRDVEVGSSSLLIPTKKIKINKIILIPLIFQGYFF